MNTPKAQTNVIKLVPKTNTSASESTPVVLKRGCITVEVMSDHTFMIDIDTAEIPEEEILRYVLTHISAATVKNHCEFDASGFDQHLWNVQIEQERQRRSKLNWFSQQWLKFTRPLRYI